MVRFPITCRACLERELTLQGPALVKEGLSVPVNHAVAELITKVETDLEKLALLKVGLTRLMAYLHVSLVPFSVFLVTECINECKW